MSELENNNNNDVIITEEEHIKLKKADWERKKAE